MMLCFSYYDQMDWRRELHGKFAVFLFPALIAVLGTRLYEWRKNTPSAQTVQRLVLALFIAALTFSIVRLTGYLMYRLNNPARSYWDLLAEAFLQEGPG